MSGIIVNGACGHMGRIVVGLAKSRGMALAGVDRSEPAADIGCPVFANFGSIPRAVVAKSDCIVDFSHHSCIGGLLEFALADSLPAVIATTGHDEGEISLIRKASERIPVFFSANYSMGVAILVRLAKSVASSMKGADIEIVETHHNRKLDAPSGTALAIANAIKAVRPGAEIVCGRSGQAKRKPEDIGISSVRLGNVAGIHEVHVATNSECVTLRHEAYSREVFADGALLAAEFLRGKPAGLYSMNDLIGGGKSE